MRVHSGLHDLPAGAGFDVVVIGAGGAGMAAALFAALEGRQVLLVEKTGYVGGTTAWSAGTTWVPGSHHAKTVNPADTLTHAARYLDNAIGERAPSALRQAFLEAGPQTIRELEDRSELKFRPYARHPDYLSDLEGATLNGRALEPLPFDGRLLGDLFPLIRPPIPEFTVFGGMMVDRTDINHLLALKRSFASMRHVLKMLLRHARDRLSHPRGTRLVMGNALVGRLLYSLAQQTNVTLALNTSVALLGRGGCGVELVELTQDGERRTVSARGGVVLASGGFNRHPQHRQDMLPGADMAWCPGAPGHTGVAQALALGLGAQWGTGGLTHAFWAPVSRRQRADGSTAVFPHFVMDRAKPGVIAVNQAGERFVNESTSYHLFGLGMLAARQDACHAPAFLICDADALRKYGLGMVRPVASAATLAPFFADGYLTHGATVQELALKLGIDAGGLARSVDQMAHYAKTGVDPDFQRGVTAYQRHLGDPAWPGKNPCLGGLKTPPYVAVRLYPGDIGAATGLATDAHAQVLDASGEPIPGLYAVGNDMHSIMGGVYTAPGITIGPGLVFARLAVRHVLARTGLS